MRLPCNFDNEVYSIVGYFNRKIVKGKVSSWNYYHNKLGKWYWKATREKIGDCFILGSSLFIRKEEAEQYIRRIENGKKNT